MVTRYYCRTIRYTHIFCSDRQWNVLDETYGSIGRGYSSKDKTESKTAYAYTKSNDENLNESPEASNGAVSDTTTEAIQNETGTSATSSVISTRRYPDRVRRPTIQNQTD